MAIIIILQLIVILAPNLRRLRRILTTVALANEVFFNRTNHWPIIFSEALTKS